uniref:Putative terminase n=1 Tax=viral metagenome TaxID=1070528 RepID=A0A6M3J592_9ZZZZ
MGVTVSKKMFADMIGKSPRWVSKLIEDGLPVIGGGGRGVAVNIDSEQAINWLVQHELRKRVSDDDEEGSSADEDRQLKRVRREKLQLEIDTIKGNLLPFDAVESILFQIASVYGSQLDALASSVASDLATINDPTEIRQRLFSECRRIRAATADQLLLKLSTINHEINGLLGTVSSDSVSAADEDG